MIFSSGLNCPIAAFHSFVNICLQDVNCRCFPMHSLAIITVLIMIESVRPVRQTAFVCRTCIRPTARPSKFNKKEKTPRTLIKLSPRTLTPPPLDPTTRRLTHTQRHSTRTRQLLIQVFFCQPVRHMLLTASASCNAMHAHRARQPRLILCFLPVCLDVVRRR